MLAVLFAAILGFLSSGTINININSGNGNSAGELKRNKHREEVVPVNVNVNVDNNTAAQSQASSHADSQVNNVNKNSNIIREAINGALSDISKVSKVRLGLYSVLTVYSTMQARLIYLTHELKNKELWSYWKDFKSVEDLYNIDKNELLDQLRADICKKYLTADNMASKDSYENEFLKDVSCEKNYILSYLNLVVWIKKFKLGKLFFLDKAFETQIKERKLRLAFIESVLLNWIAGCKITKSKKVS